MFSLRIALVWYNSFYLRNFANVFRHYEYVKACLFGLPVCPSAKDISRLVDHRYFYDEYDPARHSFMGHYTCGICRNSVSTMLLSSKLLFDDKDLLHLQPDGVTNPCVAGFVIEHVVLSSIALNGLNITPDIDRSIEWPFSRATCHHSTLTGVDLRCTSRKHL
jgi:hypothetical protein